MLNTDGVIMASEHTRHMQCRAVRFGYLSLMCAISTSPTMAMLLNETNAGSKIRPMVNSSQCSQTWRSTAHTILRCDNFTGSWCGCGELVKLNPAHADYIVFCQRCTVDRRLCGKTGATLTPGGRCFHRNCNAWMGLPMLPSFTQYS